MENEPTNTTHFGYEEIPTEDKTRRVGEVFSSVASQYDIMNDLMSAGIHRIWKRIAIQALNLAPHHHVLDLAGGTGDLTRLIHPIIKQQGQVTLSDINPDMLKVGRDRLLDQGIYQAINFVEANAEALPFNNQQFDRIIIAFGLRNVTHKSTALKEMHRVLKPGGRLIVLEFSQVTVPVLRELYDAYSFKLLPKIGKLVTGDEDSYRYLAESIRQHPPQAELQQIITDAGFDECSYENFNQGIVAIHKGFKY